MFQPATSAPLALQAAAHFAVADAPAVIAEACRIYAEFGDAFCEGARGRFETVYGRAFLASEEPGTLTVRVEASDTVNLAYVKMGVAETVIRFLGEAAPPIRWTGDGAGVVVPPFFREMRVLEAGWLTPHMRRVRLGGTELARFAQGGLHIRLLFPPEGREPVWPCLREDGRAFWADGEDRLDTRVYTIRRMDAQAGWVDIDIVIHEGDETPGSRFALGARAGDRVGMTGPGGGSAPLDRPLLLIGDETALPAIARILEMLPEDGRALALIEVDGPADEVPLPARVGIETRYLHRAGRAAGTAGLLPKALRDSDLGALGADGFVWAAGEFADFRDMRSYLRRERAWPRERHHVASYWRRGASGNEALPAD